MFVSKSLVLLFPSSFFIPLINLLLVPKHSFIYLFIFARYKHRLILLLRETIFYSFCFRNQILNYSLRKRLHNLDFFVNSAYDKFSWPPLSLSLSLMFVDYMLFLLMLMPSSNLKVCMLSLNVFRLSKLDAS